MKQTELREYCSYRIIGKEASVVINGTQENYNGLENQIQTGSEIKQGYRMKIDISQFTAK